MVNQGAITPKVQISATNFPQGDLDHLYSLDHSERVPAKPASPSPARMVKTVRTRPVRRPSDFSFYSRLRSFEDGARKPTRKQCHGQRGDAIKSGMAMRKGEDAGANANL